MNSRIMRRFFCPKVSNFPLKNNFFISNSFSTNNDPIISSPTSTTSHIQENEAIPQRKKILITGANGNIGTKLLQFWRNRHELILIDRKPPSQLINYCLLNSDLQHNYVQVNLLKDLNNFSKLLKNVDVVIHLAAQNPFPSASWADCAASIDITNNVFLSCLDVEHNIKRVIYASSNHVLGGYRIEGSTLSDSINNGYDKTSKLLPNINKIPYKPGTKFTLKNGFVHDSTPYSIAKVSGERLAYTCSLLSTNTDFIVIRIGWCQPGENLPNTLSAAGTPKEDEHKNPKSSNNNNNHNNNTIYDNEDEVEKWFRHMWLSNMDLFRLFESAVQCNLKSLNMKYTMVNGVSNNTNSRWNIENNIGYYPMHDVNNFQLNNNIKSI